MASHREFEDVLKLRACPPTPEIGAFSMRRGVPNGGSQTSTQCYRKAAMTSRIRVDFIAITVLLAVAVAWASAQVTQPPGPTGLTPMDLVAPTVVSGSDLGFRIEGNKGSVPVGRLVVRIDGRWVEAQISRVSEPLIAVPLTEQPDRIPLLPGGTTRPKR